MTTNTFDRRADQIRRSSISYMPTGECIVYAIAFDVDTEMLQQHYGSDSYNNAYKDIRNTLVSKHNFTWQQGSVYFGDSDKVNAVTCVLAVIDLARTYGWFSLSVRDIRMLRIEEQNDLMGAVEEGAA
jgi:virulence-associated protein VapD